MKNKKDIFLIISSVMFFIFLFFSSIQILVNNDLFFKKFFNNYQLYERRGVTTEDGVIIIDELVDYMENKTEQLELKKPVLDFYEYSENETLHMVDVKNIYSFFKILRNFSCVFYVVTLFYFYKNYKNSKIFKKTITSFLISILLFFGIILLVLFNFDKFWIQFHEIAFNNDLWNLSPSTDLMINVCSNQMFKSIILNSFIIYILLSIIWLLCIYFYEKKQSVNKKELTDISD